MNDLCYAQVANRAMTAANRQGADVERVREMDGMAYNVRAAGQRRMSARRSAALLVGSSHHFPDIRYISGLEFADPVVALVKGNARFLVVPSLEAGRAREYARDMEVLTPLDLGLSAGKRRRVSGWALGLLTRLRIRTVEVPANFPIAVARSLEKAGIKVRVAKGRLFEARARKGRAEIAKIRESQQAAVIAMRAAMTLVGRSVPDRRGFLRVGNGVLSAENVRAVIDRTLMEHNCIPGDTIVSCGEQAANPHERGSGPLRACASIVIDIFPRHQQHGYWGDLTRTVVKGRPSPELRAMYVAVKAAQHAALSRLKPGVKTATVHKTVMEEFLRRGFETDVRARQPRGFFHGTGHGVGLEIHEEPVIALVDGRFRKGHVVTVEPGLYYPEHGGIRIEDTVVITASGWRYLAPCEKKFEL